MKYKLLVGMVGCLSLIITAHGQKQSTLNNLPLYELADTANNKPLIIYISGDGGWNSFSQQLAGGLNKQGYAVVTLDAHKYFSSQQLPEALAKDITWIASHYLKEWKKQEFVIVGYSFGADVAAFLPVRLDKTVAGKLKSLVLLSPSSSTDFTTHVGDMLGWSGEPDRKYKLLPELLQVHLPTLCLFGSGEKLSLKTTLKDTPVLKVRIVAGDHRYDNNFKLLITNMQGFL